MSLTLSRNRRSSATPPTNRRQPRPTVGAALVLMFSLAASLGAQQATSEGEPEDPSVPDLSSDAELFVEPAELTLEVGEKAQLSARLVDRGQQVSLPKSSWLKLAVTGINPMAYV